MFFKGFISVFLVLNAFMCGVNIYRGSYGWAAFDGFFAVLYTYMFLREFYPNKEKQLRAKWWQMYYTYYTPKNQNEKLKMFARLNGFKHKTYTSGDGTKITQCILH